MPARDFKPYLEVAEETIIRFRTDLPGLAILREGLLELASNPRGLDDDETWTTPRDAEEMLVAMPGSTGSRRSPEARLREDINKRREHGRDRDREFQRLSVVLSIIEKEMPDLVAAAREKADGLFGSGSDETVEPSAAPAPSAAQTVEPSAGDDA